MTSWRGQGVRYLAVGAASNVVLYLLYLLITRVGVEPKTAMTTLFIGGMIQTFVLNKRWTFGNRRFSKAEILKYLVAYCFGYGINLLVLFFFVDVAGYRHEAVQCIAVVVIALMLFLLQKFWVFRTVKPAAVQR